MPASPGRPPRPPRTPLPRPRLWKAALALALAAAWCAAALLLWRSSVPNDLRPPDLDPRRYFSSTELGRAERYEQFLRINLLLSQAMLLIVLALYAWRGGRFTRESAAGRIGTGMLLAMLGLALVWLAQLPFRLADVWWQRRHGTSRVDYLEWIVEDWFTLGGEFLFICLGFLIAMGLAGALRDRWWVAGAPAFIGLALVFAFVYPYLVPDVQPVRKPVVAADARRLARAQDVQDTEVVVEEVGELTTLPNAEAVGLGSSRRVILWDTLLDGRFSREQVRVVIAHELAHHSRDHIWESLGWYALFALPGTFLVAVATRRRGGLYQPRAVPLALLVLVVLDLAGQPIGNVVSRRLETEADWTALETTRDPAAARGLFRRFGTTALAQPDPPGWFHLLFDSHPTIMDRIELATAWEARRRPST